MNEKGTRPDVLRVRGIMEKGYGIIPKIPMQDIRLTIEAKAIYSYFRSFSGAGTTAFPSRDKILYDLQISKDRFYRHFDLLKKYGYIEVSQNIDSTGKFKNNIYTLIELIEPCLQNKDTDKKSCPYFTDTDNPDTENKDTKNNNLKNITRENQQSESTSDITAELSSKEKNDKTMKQTIDSYTTKENFSEKKKELLQTAPTPDQSVNGLQSPSGNTQFPLDDYTAYKQIIQDNISYSHYLDNRHADIELIDELINCMIDVICTKGDTVKINGEKKSRNMVISQYLKINSMDIDHILDRYKEQHHKITHLNAYLKTMLYTVKQENGHYYTNAVRADYLGI